MESDRGAEFYNSIFQNYLEGKNIQHYSGFTDKGLWIAERVIRNIHSLLKKPVFEKGNADSLSELPSVIKKIKIQPTTQQKRLWFKLLKNQMKKMSILIFKIEELDNNKNINYDS